MVEACGMNVIKFLIFIFNAFFALCGILLIVAGALAYADFGKYSHFLEGKIVIPPLILLVVGFFVFFIASLGCCGAIKENYFMLLAFGAFLLIIFLTQLVIGVTAAVAKDDFANAMRLSLRKSLGNYTYTDVDRQAWDSTQRYLQCCGVDSPRDWSQVFAENQVPASCCRNAPDSPIALCRNTFDDGIVFQQAPSAFLRLFRAYGGSSEREIHYDHGSGYWNSSSGGDWDSTQLLSGVHYQKRTSDITIILQSSSAQLYLAPPPSFSPPPLPTLSSFSSPPSTPLLPLLQILPPLSPLPVENLTVGPRAPVEPSAANQRFGDGRSGTKRRPWCILLCNLGAHTGPEHWRLFPQLSVFDGVIR
ncbi:hypothetical protein M8J76_000812 [Diaphorina citri]|nr:hypothetical protein M8J76_000812 [Diaphorina citri]